MNKSDNKLQPTSISLLLGFFLMTSSAVFFALEIWLRAGRSPFALPLFAFVVPLSIAGVVLWQAWLVRSYKLGNRSLGALNASRIWLLTQTASRAGIILAGASLAVVVAYSHFGLTSYLTSQILNFSLAFLGWMIVTIVGFCGERWCISDDDDTNDLPDYKNKAGGTAQPA